MPKIIGPRAKILESRAQNECRVNAPLKISNVSGEVCCTVADRFERERNYWTILVLYIHVKHKLNVFDAEVIADTYKTI